jgi:hypothetical protein
VLVADRTGRSFPAFLPVLVVSALGAAGCWSSHADLADGETPDVVVPEDGGAAEDATGTEDAGVPDDGGLDDGGLDDGGLDDGGLDDGGGDDAGVDDGDVPDDASSPCPEGWYDSTTGLCWQDPPAATGMTWYDAVSYCENLVLGGHPVGTWRLPTISELRSLIRGCPATETGGACGVTDSCTGDGCGSWGPCVGCSGFSGPGAGGLYWPPELAAFYGHWSWSSSSYSGSSSRAWRVYFDIGRVDSLVKANSGNVRCIRRGP